MNEEPKPSEWAEMRLKNKKENDKKTELLLKEQRLLDAKPYIDGIMKWLNEPKELRAYISHMNSDQICEAIDVMNIEESYKSILADKQNRNSVLILKKHRMDMLKFVEKMEEQERLEQERLEQENEDRKNLIQLEAIETKKKTQGYSPYCRQRIIDEAVRLSEEQDKWRELELIEVLDISQSTLDRQKQYFKLNIRQIRDEAQAIIREKNK